MREECSPQTWSRAVTQARSGQLSGKRCADGSLEVRMATKGGLISPLVTLFPDEDDWSCECPSGEAVCQHAAAAVIVLAQAEREGRDLMDVRKAAPSLVYALRAVDNALSLARFTKQGDTLEPLKLRLLEERRRGDDAAVALTQADVEIDLLLGNMQHGPLPRAFMPKLLSWLSQCDQVTLDGQPIALGEAAFSVCARVEKKGDGFRVFAAKHPSVRRAYTNGAVLTEAGLCSVRDPSLSDADFAALKKGRTIARHEVADLVGRILPSLRAHLPVLVPEGLLPTAEQVPPRIALAADVRAGVLEVLPTIVYGDPPCARIDNGKLSYLGGPVVQRDPGAEARLAQVLRQRLGLEVGRRERLETRKAAELATRVHALDNISLSGEGLSSFAMHGALTPELELSDQSFELRFNTRDGQTASAEAVLAAFQHDSPLVALSGGGFADVPRDFLAQHAHLVLDLLHAREDGKAPLPPAAWVDVARLADALDHPAPEKLAELQRLSQGFAGIPSAPLPVDLTASLRSYQLAGYHWLRFLSKAGLGALLADDMGLGKTLQALCALDSPALVVCPASVLFNWANEIARFRPEQKVCVYHGPQRALDPSADVTLTTYAVMRLDSEALSARAFDTVVLDEAQTIKNPDSQVAQAAFGLRARFRIALTGTPVENRLTDLFSLFQFLHPGLLGRRSDFAERYEKPIAEGDAQTAKRLRTRIKPFVLRRLKRDVAKELPPRTDVVLRCTLDADERALYEGIRAATQADIVAQLGGGGSVLAALEALLRLRQACCHRALLPGQNAARSSKLELLLETLEEALSEGHKALVFSQWTSLLDLVEPLLRERAMGFTRLDGTTKDRGKVVSTFQEDPKTQVMLLSLKAGGTGLNLTAADHVFLLDPWWNPAAEDQAADRAHRIGQERPVLVHRLVAAESVEERILALQEKKRAIAAVATDAGAQAASITRDDLLALLS